MSSLSVIDTVNKTHYGNEIVVPDLEDILALRLDFSAELKGELEPSSVGYQIGSREEKRSWYTDTDPSQKGIRFCAILTLNGYESLNPEIWARQQEAIAEYGSGCEVRDGYIRSFLIQQGPNAIKAYVQTWAILGKTNGASVDLDITGIYYSIPEEETGGPSYCDAVEGEDGTGDQSPAWISMPQIMIRPGGCTQIGGWTINLGWIASIAETAGIDVPESLQIFGLNVCFTEINFGEIGILGIKINLDLLAAVAAGVALIRIFR